MIGILFPPFQILVPFILSVCHDRLGISWATENKFVLTTDENGKEYFAFSHDTKQKNECKQFPNLVQNV